MCFEFRPKAAANFKLRYLIYSWGFFLENPNLGTCEKQYSPKLYIPITIKTQMNLVLSLLFGKSGSQCQGSAENFCNFV